MRATGWYNVRTHPGRGQSGPAAGRRAWPAGSSGMTLAEVLVAVAILSVLFGLLFMPLMKTFGYIHSGNVRIGVQDTGRILLEEIQRDIANALYIYDNEDDPTRASIIFVLPNGLGANASTDPSGATQPPQTLPLLLVPGPGPDYNLSSTLHVHWQLGLVRGADPYVNFYEVSNTDLRSLGVTPPSNSDLEDNFYRVFRAEYYPTDPAGTATPTAQALVLSSVLGSALYTSPDLFRLPGQLFDDSLQTGERNSATYQDSAAVLARRQKFDALNFLSTMTPVDTDAAWAQYTPAVGGNPAVFSIRPGMRLESQYVSGEALDSVLAGAYPYPAGFKADFGHWQQVRRYVWAYPKNFDGSVLPRWARYFQVFDVLVRQNANRQYYVAARPDPSATGDPTRVDATNSGTWDRFVFKRSDPGANPPVDGVWPAADKATFSISRYWKNIDAFRKAAPTAANWVAYDPYDTMLLPTDPTKPYWPEMAFLVDADRGSVEFRLDAPVRQPSDTVQPDGRPMAPFQAPWDPMVADPEFPPPVGVDPNDATKLIARTDWILPDVARANALHNSGDHTYCGVRIPAETMRVMVYEPVMGGGYAWQIYTRVAKDPGRKEFTFDEQSGLLSLGDENKAYWVGTDGKYDVQTRLRAWYSIQTDAADPWDTANPVGTTTVTASYYTKEIWRLTLALRAYDGGTGRAHTFQQVVTLRPRNLR